MVAMSPAAFFPPGGDGERGRETGPGGGNGEHRGRGRYGDPPAPGPASGRGLVDGGPPDLVDSQSPLSSPSSASPKKREEPQRQEPRRVDHSYRDYSKYPLSELPPGKKPPSNFPSKLHQILSSPQYAHIISWMPHGRAWKIHDKELLVSDVVSKYFVQSKYESFTRQLNGWGFKRLHQSGNDYNAYYHECFLRGLPYLTALLKRVKSNQGRLLPHVEGEPNFYEMQKQFPLPLPVPTIGLMPHHHGQYHQPYSPAHMAHHVGYGAPPPPEYFGHHLGSPRSISYQPFYHGHHDAHALVSPYAQAQDYPQYTHPSPGHYPPYHGPQYGLPSPQYGHPSPQFSHPSPHHRYPGPPVPPPVPQFPTLSHENTPPTEEEVLLAPLPRGFYPSRNGEEEEDRWAPLPQGPIQEPAGDEAN